MNLLTATRLRDSRACLRLHHNRYELGYRPVEDADNLRFGSLVHRGLEAWWRAPVEGRLEAAVDAIRAWDADPYDRAKAEVLLAGYNARWGDEHYEVLGVEVRFETDLINPATGVASKTWRLAGVLDVLVRDLRDGLVRIMEHKTSASDITPGSPYFQQLRLDSQISVYFAGADALGRPAASCLYDVLGKPGLRPLKATPPESRKFKQDGTLYANQRAEDETVEEYRARLADAIADDPNRYFQRVEVVRLEDELREHGFELWQQALLLREAQRAGIAPRNGDACFRFGRACEFFQVCTGAASLDDTRLFTRRTDPHPELAGQGGEARPKEEVASP